MKLQILKKTKTELEVEITNEDETILHPITHVLLKNDDVEYASCMADHPLSNKRRLFIRVKKGDPIQILKKAVQYLEDEIKTFGKNFE
ncbi:MAG: DNA-directed RNA polymerase subunit L [Candidatus Thermoplasmatota archaeon]